MGKGKGEKYRHSTSMKHTVDSFIHPCGVAVYRFIMQLLEREGDKCMQECT